MLYAFCWGISLRDISQHYVCAGKRKNSKFKDSQAVNIWEDENLCLITRFRCSSDEIGGQGSRDIAKETYVPFVLSSSRGEKKIFIFHLF